MVTKYQRHPTNPAIVILHVIGFLSSFAADGETVAVNNQAYRDALEAAGKMED